MSETPRTIDFPVSLPPFVVKELRQGLRGKAFQIILISAPIVICFIFLLSFVNDKYGEPILPSDGLNFIYWAILSAMMIMGIPTTLLTGVKSEINNKTSDMLVLTKLTPWRIVLGKWCASMVLSTLIILTLLPSFLMRYYYGSVDLWGDLIWIAVLFCGCSFFSALALFASNILILRILAYIGFVAAGIAVLTLHAELPDLRESNEMIGVLLVILINLMSGTVLFLLLASRWFAPPSDNTSKRVRLCLLLFLLPFCVPLLMMDSLSASETETCFYSAMVMAFYLIGFVFLIELTQRAPLLPVHLTKRKDSKFALLKNVFLVPGFFSAAMSFASFLFLILLALLAGSFFMDIRDMRETLIVAWILILALVWADIIIPIFILHQFRRKINITVAYLIFIAVCMFIPPLFDWDEDTIGMLFIPWVNVAYGCISPKVVPSLHQLCIVGGLFAASLICLAASVKPWLTAVKTANLQDRQ